MAINFPVSLDDLANVNTGDTITPAHKNDLNDIVEALEAKVGIDSSAVATSHDYLLTHLPAQAQNFDVGAYNVRGLTLTSDVTVGTIPVNVISTTMCTNLNADTVDGTHLAGLQTILTNSAGLRAALNDETGSGLAVFNNTPTLVTPVLGAATATSINGLTIDTTTGTLDVTNGKTLAVTGNATISATPYTPGGTDVALTDGGTGASTQAGAANAVLPSQTSNANKVLRSDGTNVSWQNPTDLAIASQARGDILYFDGTNWKRLAKGTNGQYLKIGANDPAWATASLGSWVDKSSSYGAQQATTDGFVLAYSGKNLGDGQTIRGYTDANANPTTVRQECMGSAGVTIGGSICMPVKKNDYWKVVVSAGTPTVYWIPLGS